MKENIQRGNIKAKAKMLWYRFLGAIHYLPPLDPRIQIIGTVTNLNSVADVSQKTVAVLSKQSGGQ